MVLVCDFALRTVRWTGLRTEPRLRGTRAGSILGANAIQCLMAGHVLGAGGGGEGRGSPGTESVAGA